MASHLHPMRHEWLLRGDHVTEKRGKRILEFVREEVCNFCPRERISKIDADVWKVLSRRYKGENVPLEEREQDSSVLADEIAASTNLPELRDQINARAKRGKR